MQRSDVEHGECVERMGEVLRANVAVNPVSQQAPDQRLGLAYIESVDY
jgi:hypothetical protein